MHGLSYLEIRENHINYFGVEIMRKQNSVCNPSIRDGVLRSGMLLYLHLILK